MRKDVLDLIDAHYIFTTERGVSKEELGYLVRSAIVMLCAAWERYNEDLLLEVIDLTLIHALDSTVLPTEVQKTISARIRGEKHELAPMRLADSGWKAIWRTYATGETDALNTPSRANLNKLFKAYLGLPEYSLKWTEDGRMTMNQFISDRGEIAHNGNRARAISIEELRIYQDMVVGCVIEIDSNMAGEMERRIGDGASVWDRIYSRGSQASAPSSGIAGSTTPPTAEA